MSIRSGAKTKNVGVAGWKVCQTRHRDNCSRAKKYNTSMETLLAKQIFSLLVWDRQLKFMFNISQCGSTRNNRNIQAKNCFYLSFCTRDWLMSERLWQTALADHCIYKRLKNIRLSYWRLIWRQNCFDLYHWALGRSEKFHFEHFEN